MPLCDAHGVDMVFCGHDHNFERSWPLRGDMVVSDDDEPDYVDPGGTIFVVTGGGGLLYDSSMGWHTAFSRSVPHYVRIDMDGPHHGHEVALNRRRAWVYLPSAGGGARASRSEGSHGPSSRVA